MAPQPSLCGVTNIGLARRKTEVQMKRFVATLSAACLIAAILGICTGVAGAAGWLLSGSSLTGFAASELKGEVKFVDKKLGIGLKCSLVFEGTIGPGSDSSVDEVLNSGHVLVTLSAPLSCKKETDCEEGTDIYMSPEGLPWDGVLSRSSEKFFNASFGVGYWVSCLELGVRVSEECS